MNYQQQIERIQSKIQKQGVKLNNVLSPGYIQSIEQQKGITLPESYVAFLTQIGNGGEGPHYGIYTLEDSLRSTEDNGADITTYNECIKDKVIDNPEKLTEEEYEEKTGESLGEILEGSVDICEYGCGDFFRLIITGATAGNIWNYSWSDPNLYNLECDILTFYENWLDRQIEEQDNPDKEYPAILDTLKYGNNTRYHYK